MTAIVLPRPASPPKTAARLIRLAQRSIPRSLVIAVVGIGLSSWFIPAFTRQWDDRQRAGDLKAAVVTQMATTTGRALLDAQAFFYTAPSARPSPGANAEAVRKWSVAALEVRAKLDAYFGADAVTRWDAVTDVVHVTLSRVYGEAYIPAARRPDTAPPPEHLQDLYYTFYKDGTGLDELVEALLDEEETAARDVLAMNVRGYSTTWHDILHDLLPTV
jgi:hypothetical protein